METDYFLPRGGQYDRAPAFVHESLDNADVLHVFGDLDFAAVPEFEAALQRAVRAGYPLVVDLTACTHIEAACLGVLTRARATHGSAVRVRTAEGIVRRIFDITGLSYETAKSMIGPPDSRLSTG
jgi:anti-anti-sigma factor